MFAFSFIFVNSVHFVHVFPFLSFPFIKLISKLLQFHFYYLSNTSCIQIAKYQQTADVSRTRKNMFGGGSIQNIPLVHSIQLFFPISPIASLYFYQLCRFIIFSSEISLIPKTEKVEVRLSIHEHKVNTQNRGFRPLLLNVLIPSPTLTLLMRPPPTPPSTTLRVLLCLSTS